METTTEKREFDVKRLEATLLSFVNKISQKKKASAAELKAMTEAARLLTEMWGFTT